jgi:hypothetical protein
MSREPASEGVRPCDREVESRLAVSSGVSREYSAVSEREVGGSTFWGGEGDVGRGGVLGFDPRSLVVTFGPLYVGNEGVSALDIFHGCGWGI